MSDVMHFLAMGGYAWFVWGAFGATGMVLIGLLLASLRSLKNNEAMLAGLEATLTGKGDR